MFFYAPGLIEPLVLSWVLYMNLKFPNKNYKKGKKHEGFFKKCVISYEQTAWHNFPEYFPAIN